jgi:hypothetical protein
MRNRKRLLRTMGATAALIAATTMVNTAQAGAVKWNPVNKIATGSVSNAGFSLAGGGYTFACNQSSFKVVTTVTGNYATTQGISGGGLTFSSPTCTWNGFSAPVAMTATGEWRVTPTSTTTATIAVPTAGLKVIAVPGSPELECTITIAPNAPINLPATWSNTTHKLTLVSSSVPVVVSGSPNTGCGSSGNRTLSMANGWYFPDYTIIN